MTKAKSPFPNFDPSDMFQAMPFNPDAFMNAVKRNSETAMAVSRMQADCAQAIWQRQATSMQRNFQQAAEAAQSMTNGKPNPEAATRKSAEAARKAMENNMKEAQDIAAMVSEANQDAFNMMNRRFKECVAEMQDAFQPSKKRSTA